MNRRPNRSGQPHIWLAGAFALAIATSVPLAAQEHPITWSLVTPPSRVTQGAVVKVRLRAIVPAGWHLYSLTQGPGGPTPTTISAAAGSPFLVAGPIAAPDPEIAPDRNFDILSETYADSVTFAVPVAARTAGRASLALLVSYQTCNDRYCLPVTSDVVESPVAVAASMRETPERVVAAPAGPIAAGGRAASPPAASRDAAVRTPLRGGASPTQSLPRFLWLAAVMGALSLLTPCVFPMIPITVSYFTRTGEKASGSPTRNALIYAAGIMATFTVLGIAIAILAGAGEINRFAANPWVNVLITAIFIAFALNLFGIWQFTLPSAWLTRLTAMSHGSRHGETVGILAMASTFTLTSFTCTAPFVGTLLVMAAHGSWQWPLLGMLAFSGVFALPFFLLAMMPSAIAKLPRAGSWMNTVKVVMGFLEVATAMKFLSNADLIWQWGIVTRNVVLVIWMAVSVATAAYLAGAFAQARPRPRIPAAQLLASGLCVLIAFGLGRGIGGARLGEIESFLPPPEGVVTSGTASPQGELSWMVNDYPGGLARAKAEHKAMLVDFTGYTCTNCRWMEANMFPRPEISRELEKFVRVRLYTDGQGEQYRRQQKMQLETFGTVALPYYAVYDSLGNPQSQFLGMTRSTGEFLQFLRTTSR